MRKTAIVISAGLALIAHGAAAAEISGGAALSLAARIGDRSPLTTLRAKGLLGSFLDGRSQARYLGSGAVEVRADAVDCQLGNVDITAKQCRLTFGAKVVAIQGRDAQALYATLIEAGVPASGAAGSSHASLTNLVCTIDPVAVKARTGGGATCSFSPAA
jgi:hypothetical protein